MKRSTVLVFALFSFACATKPTPTANAPKFAYCPPAKFANCTLAKCQRQPNGNYACWCFEDDRYSATAWAGSQAKSCMTNATTLQSRFHPVTSYQVCADPKTQTTEWAWCLGVSCTPSKNPADPNSTANVRCDCLPIPANVPPFPYIVTTKTYAAENCTIGTTGMYWSSATPTDVTGITKFLQEQPGLRNLLLPEVLQPLK